MAPNSHQRARRSRDLRIHGLTWDQIASVWQSDHPEIGPRTAFRWAHDLTQERVAEIWNELDAGKATVSKARIWEYESWPASGRRPSVAALDMLARVYQTKARRLLTEDEYLHYSASARMEIDRINYRHLDSAYRLSGIQLSEHEPVAKPVTVIDNSPSAAPSAPLSIRIDEWARESGASLTVAEASNVGPATIERLNADLSRIAAAYLKVPVVPLLSEMRRVRDEALQLLQGRQPLRYRRELYSLTGWAMTLLAWVSTDLGRPDSADTHARAAWHFAEEADNHELRAWICKTWQVAAYWEDRRGEAVQLAERGRVHAAHAGGETELMLMSTLALDLARLGRRQDAQNVLARAQEIDVTSSSQAAPGGPLSCFPERALSYWADAYLVLGNPAQALASAIRAIELSQEQSEMSRNLGTERMTRLHVVRAHIDMGELEGAAEALASVLNTPSELRAAPLMIQLQEVAHRIPAALNSSALTRDIHDAIVTFSRESQPMLDGDR